jgi:hypothetical protein
MPAYVTLEAVFEANPDMFVSFILSIKVTEE